MSVPRIEALALPNHVEQTTSEPTPIWINYNPKETDVNITLHPSGIQSVLKRSQRGILSHPRTSTLTMFKTWFTRTLREFRYVSNRALSKRLLYVWIMFPTLSPPCIALSHCDSTILDTAWATLPCVISEPVWAQHPWNKVYNPSAKVSFFFKYLLTFENVFLKNYKN